MCLNWGCIPTKALLETAWRLVQVKGAADMGVVGVDAKSVGVDWTKATTRVKRIVARLIKGVEYLEKKNNVDLIKALGEPQGGGVVKMGEKEIKAKHLIVATGSRPDREPVKAAGKRAMEIGAFLQIKELPGAAAVWGHGPVAVEIALLLALLGVETALVAGEERLLSKLDGDLGAWTAKRLKKAGVKLHLGRALAKEMDDGVELDDGSLVPASFVVNGSERVPVLQALKNLDLVLEDGFVKVDAFGRTSSPGVYAVGDLTGKTMLAHGASAQGLAAVNHIAGSAEPVDYDRVPWNIYLYPEVASIGLSEEALKERGAEFDKSVFPLTANSKALLQGETDGFVKVLADKKYGEVLGVHIVAPNATDMIGEAALAMRLESTALDVGAVVHAHPTLSETMLEAALGIEDMTIHM
jgi:dihydrolipoamide dehydrogenase